MPKFYVNITFTVEADDLDAAYEIGEIIVENELNYDYILDTNINDVEECLEDE